MKRAVIIVHRGAGKGLGGVVAARAEKVLAESGYAVDDAFPTEYPRHATELARERGTACDRLVVIGGDGTLREAAAGLHEAGATVEVGFVPLGNANVVARDLRIPLDPEAALALAARGTARPVDVGLANGALFLAMVGVGFDALVTRWVDGTRRTAAGGWLYRRFGDGLYAVAGAAAALLRVIPQRFRLAVDGAPPLPKSSTVLICNAETYGKGWAATPGATMTDGALDYVACRDAAGPAVLRWLRATASRRSAPALACYGRGRRFEITSHRKFLWQADGDPMPAVLHLEVVVVPGRLRIVTPT